MTVAGQTITVGPKPAYLRDHQERKKKIREILVNICWTEAETNGKKENKANLQSTFTLNICF